MRKYYLAIFICGHLVALSQEHFAGANTSQRVGILNADINPAQLTNLSAGYHINIFAVSAKVSNNIIGFEELTNGTDLDQLIFTGNKNVDMRADAEIFGPGFALKINKWGFAITSKAHIKSDLVDVNPNLGNALANSTVNLLENTGTAVNNASNQRIIGTSWGEIGLSAARNIFEDNEHKINGGLAIKILFPGSYANFGASGFRGTIVNNTVDNYLTDASADLNIAYSGNLGENFTEFSDYTSTVFGKPNGFAVDLGANYQLKNDDGSNLLDFGVSLRNIGSMKFTSENNAATNYRLTITNDQRLDLNQFNNVESLQNIEAILISSGYVNRVVNDKKAVKVKLPTLFTGYADVAIDAKFHMSLFTQIKVKKNEMNDQITEQNIISLTPKFTLNNFEVYLPLSQSEVSGFATGFGFRIYGIVVGSGSIFSALVSDSKQFDAYIGYNIAFN